MDEEQYAETLSGPNMNREEYGTTATNVDDALSVLSFDGSEKEDRHPERYGHLVTTHLAQPVPLFPSWVAMSSSVHANIRLVPTQVYDDHAAVQEAESHACSLCRARAAKAEGGQAWLEEESVQRDDLQDVAEVA